MVKRADHKLVAAEFVTVDALVLVRVVQSLHCCVALVALQALRAGIPASALNKSFAVFCRVLEDFNWPSKVTHVVGINAAFAVVRIFLGWTPTGLVVEHVENILVFFVERIPDFGIQKRTV